MKSDDFTPVLLPCPRCSHATQGHEASGCCRYECECRCTKGAIIDWYFESERHATAAFWSPEIAENAK